MTEYDIDPLSEYLKTYSTKILDGTYHCKSITFQIVGDNAEQVDRVPGALQQHAGLLQVGQQCLPILNLLTI